MPEKSWVCIFCRNSSNPTEEHIVPDWLSKIFTKEPLDKNIFETRDPIAGTSKHHIRQGHLITRKVKAVCYRCNTGWLSQLEEELKTVLTKLITGAPCVLDDWTQRRLATWSVKTAMTAEFLDPETVAISFDMREYLRLYRQPHPDFDVFIGSYKGDDELFRWDHNSTELFNKAAGKGSTGIRNTQITTLGIGQLFIEVGYLWPVIGRFDIDEVTANAFRRIWPLPESNINWPPNNRLNAHHIEAIESGVQNLFRNFGAKSS